MMSYTFRQENTYINNLKFLLRNQRLKCTPPHPWSWHHIWHTEKCCILALPRPGGQLSCIFQLGVQSWCRTLPQPQLQQTASLGPVRPLHWKAHPARKRAFRISPSPNYRDSALFAKPLKKISHKKKPLSKSNPKQLLGCRSRKNTTRFTVRAWKRCPSWCGTLYRNYEANYKQDFQVRGLGFQKEYEVT